MHPPSEGLGWVAGLVLMVLNYSTLADIDRVWVNAPPWLTVSEQLFDQVVKPHELGFGEDQGGSA